MGRQAFEHEGDAGHLVVGDVEHGQPVAQHGDEVRQAGAGHGASRTGARG